MQLIRLIRLAKQDIKPFNSEVSSIDIITEK